MDLLDFHAYCHSTNRVPERKLDLFDKLMEKAILIRLRKLYRGWE